MNKTLRKMRVAAMFVVALCATQGANAQLTVSDYNQQDPGNGHLLYELNVSEKTAVVAEPNATQKASGWDYSTYPSEITVLDSISVPPFDLFGTLKVLGVGTGAFKNCTNITSVKLPKGCTTIGDSAFYNSGITEFSLPSDFNGSIGKHAFEDCKNLKLGSLSGATTLDNSSFLGYTPADKKFVIPASVTKVGSSILRKTVGSTTYGGSSLELDSLIIEDSDTPISGSGGWNSNALAHVNVHNYYIGRNVSNMRIAGAYYYESLTIGPKVTSLSSYMSSGRTESYLPLNKVQTLNPDPSALSPTFNDKIYGQATLVVPDGTLEAYKADAYWGKFLNIMEATQYATNIKGVSAESGNAVETARYGIDGKQLGSPRKGVNIIKMSDGAVKKVIVK